MRKPIINTDNPAANDAERDLSLALYIAKRDGVYADPAQVPACRERLARYTLASA